MSSFVFDGPFDGPPADENNQITSQIIDEEGLCEKPWVCEHRWKPIVEMIKFRNVVGTAWVQNWWDNDSNQIAFSRGNRGFIAFNGQYGVDMSQRLQTGLAAGTYCDIATGVKSGSSCTGGSVTVGSDGFANIFLSSQVAEGFIAIHVDSKL